jgi:hypothetical protein
MNGQAYGVSYRRLRTMCYAVKPQWRAFPVHIIRSFCITERRHRSLARHINEHIGPRVNRVRETHWPPKGQVIGCHSIDKLCQRVEVTKGSKVHRQYTVVRSVFNEVSRGMPLTGSIEWDELRSRCT